MRNRVVRVDFGGIVRGLLALPKGTPEEMRRAKAARDLVAAISGERRAPELSAAYLMSLEESAFDDARRMLDGAPEEAALRAALEAIDGDSWARMSGRIARLEPAPDPSVAPELV